MSAAAEVTALCLDVATDGKFGEPANEAAVHILVSEGRLRPGTSSLLKAMGECGMCKGYVAIVGDNGENLPALVTYDCRFKLGITALNPDTAQQG